jgi:hypothetical protein
MRQHKISGDFEWRGITLKIRDSNEYITRLKSDGDEGFTICALFVHSASKEPGRWFCHIECDNCVVYTDKLTVAYDRDPLKELPKSLENLLLDVTKSSMAIAKWLVKMDQTKP